MNNMLFLNVFSRLKHLNLQGNRISEIPYFPLTGSLALLQTVVEEQAEEDGLGKFCGTICFYNSKKLCMLFHISFSHWVQRCWRKDNPAGITLLSSSPVCIFFNFKTFLIKAVSYCPSNTGRSTGIDLGCHCQTCISSVWPITRWTPVKNI